MTLEPLLPFVERKKVHSPLSRDRATIDGGLKIRGKVRSCERREPEDWLACGQEKRKYCGPEKEGDPPATRLKEQRTRAQKKVKRYHSVRTWELESQRGIGREKPKMSSEYLLKKKERTF